VYVEPSEWDFNDGLVEGGPLERCSQDKPEVTKRPQEPTKSKEILFADLFLRAK